MTAATKLVMKLDNVALESLSNGYPEGGMNVQLTDTFEGVVAVMADGHATGCPRACIERVGLAFGAQAEVRRYKEPSRLPRYFNPPHALLAEEYDRARDATHVTRVALQRVVVFSRQHLGAPAQEAS